MTRVFCLRALIHLDVLVIPLFTCSYFTCIRKLIRFFTCAALFLSLSFPFIDFESWWRNESNQKRGYFQDDRETSHASSPDNKCSNSNLLSFQPNSLPATQRNSTNHRSSSDLLNLLSPSFSLAYSSSPSCHSPSSDHDERVTPLRLKSALNWTSWLNLENQIRTHSNLLINYSKSISLNQSSRLHANTSSFHLFSCFPSSWVNLLPLSFSLIHTLHFWPVACAPSSRFLLFTPSPKSSLPLRKSQHFSPLSHSSLQSTW